MVGMNDRVVDRYQAKTGFYYDEEFTEGISLHDRFKVTVEDVARKLGHDWKVDVAGWSRDYDVWSTDLRSKTGRFYIEITPRTMSILFQTLGPWSEVRNNNNAVMRKFNRDFDLKTGDYGDSLRKLKTAFAPRAEKLLKAIEWQQQDVGLSAR